MIFKKLSPTIGARGILAKLMIVNTMWACHGIRDRGPTLSVVQGNSSASYGASSMAPPGGDYTVGDAKSIEAFAQWSPRERALMIVSADNGIYNTQNPMTPRKLPYLKLKPRSAAVEEYLQQYPNDEGVRRQFKKFSQKFSSEACQENILIPYHPDTKSQHSRIGFLKKQGDVIDGDKRHYQDLVGFTSMSRSLFVLNEKTNDGLPLLSSLKVGSDMVMGSYQPDKLNGVFWNARYVNSLSEPTSIHELAEENGIAFLSDSVGLVYDGDYGVVLRDYSPLVNEKDYFFMPLMAFQEKAVEKKSPSGDVNEYLWNLYKPASANVFDKNKKILRLIVPKAQVEKMVDQLAQDMGKLIAIYYLNGITSLDLHGQNLMVGIPLKPERQAMIAVRDTSDHWVFPYVRTRYGQLKNGAIPEPNWCQVFFGSSEKAGMPCRTRMEQLTLKGFWEMAQKLEFKFQGTDFQTFKTTESIYDHLENNKVYGEQIRKVRARFKPMASSSLPKPRSTQAIRCLRSAGCPFVRARAIP